MATRSMLKLFAFSTHDFDAPGEAQALVDLLVSGPFAATRFGSAEPIRRPLTGQGRLDAAALLRGGEGAHSGSVFLAGDDPRATFMFAWQRGVSSLWFGEFDARLADRPERCQNLAAALVEMFSRLPAQFAGVAPAADWDGRHWLVEEDEDGGEVETKLGLDLRSHLPGVYWWTLFGKEVTKFFGRRKLLSAPAARAVDLGAGGVALLADACPQRNPPGQLSAAEARLRDALGAEYFFDIGDAGRTGPGVPGVTHARP